MKPGRVRFIAFSVALTTILALPACGGPATSMPAAQETETVAPSAAAEPSPTATATPFAAVGIGTPLPVEELVPITAENAARLREVAVYGEVRGAKLLPPDGKLVLHERPGGADVLEADGLELVVKLEYDRLLDYTADGTQFLLLDGEELVLSDLDGRREVIPLDEASKVDGSPVVAAAYLEKEKWVVLTRKEEDGPGKDQFLDAQDGSLVEVPPEWASFRMFSPDGKHALNADGAVRLEDNKTVLSGLDFYRYQFSPSGQYLAGVTSASYGGIDELIIWDLEIGHSVFRTPIADTWTAEWKIDPTGQMVAVLDPGEMLRVWRIADGQLMHAEATNLMDLGLTRVDETGQIGSVSGLNGPAVPWAASSASWRLWATPSWHRWMRGGGVSVAFNPDGTELRVSRNREQSTNYRWTSGEACILPLSGTPICHEFLQNVVILNSDGEFYTLYGNSYKRGLLDESGEVVVRRPVLDVPWENEAVIAATVPVWLGVFVIAKNDLFKLMATNGESTFERKGGIGYAVSLDQSALAVYDVSTSLLEIVSVESMQPRSERSFLFDTGDVRIAGGARGLQPALGLSADGRRLALLPAGNLTYLLGQLGTRPQIIFMDAEPGAPPVTVDLPEAGSLDAGVADPTFSPDGSLVAVSVGGNTLLIDVAAGEVLPPIIDAPALSMAFSRDGKLLAVFTAEPLIRVFGIQP